MNTTRRGAARRPFVALAALACTALFAAAPARAGGEFRNGFEDQLGRLAAFEAFHLGRVLLLGYPGPVHEVHYAPRPAPHHRHGHPGRHLGHHRHHHRAPCAIDHSHKLQRGRNDRFAVREGRAHRRHERRGEYHSY